MDDGFELLDAHAAQEFLMGFSTAIRRKGEACFRSGCVLEVIPEKPGAIYSAQVQDGKQQDVTLCYEPSEGWDAECSCDRGEDCEHIFAAMTALLTEHGAATVRSLSAGTRVTWDRRGGGSSVSKPEAADDRSLADLLTAATGRPLTKEQTNILRGIRGVYGHCRQIGQITAYNFQQMGFPVPDNGWAPLQIWPAFPNTEHGFWLYVANALQERGLELPEFMLPITDLAATQERVKQWRRTQAVEGWKQTLTHLELAHHQTPATAQAETDLRLVVDARDIYLQRRRPSQTVFETLKHSQLRQVTSDYESGLLRLTIEAEFLWQIFNQRFYYCTKTQWRYTDPETPRLLGRVLRMRLLEGRVVSPDGQPLARPAGPLRWELVPAADEQDDYRLRLVQASGAPAPPFLAILPGRPSLYLTSDTVFTGPDWQDRLLKHDTETRIPAPALETATGATFVRSLGLELPPRMSERVRTLSYQVAIQCELRRLHPSEDTEICSVEVRAEAPDGREQTWAGYNWLDTTPEGLRRKIGNARTITVYDSATLQEIPPLMEPLRLKPATYGDGLTLRVTRKFGEVFSAWLKTVPPHITVQLKGELASFVSADVAGRVKLEVTEAEIDWFDLRVVLDVADATLTAAEIKLLLAGKGNYVRLEGKGWRRLQYDLSEDENERLARLGLSTRELSAEPQRLHALQLADDAAKKFLPEQQVEQIQRRASEIKARVAPALPAGVTASLRPYQLEGFHFLAYLSTNRFGGILADDMGLGKTLQALAWLLWLREQAAEAAGTDGKTSGVAAAPPQTSPSLVVCPKSVIDNWHAEAARFTPGLRVRAWSAGELGNLAGELDSADLHVINYSQLRSVSETITTIRWQSVILDEGQYIKNPSSQTARVARALKAEHRLILSGTPIENRLLDLWSLMAYAMPGVLGHRAQFGRLYETKGDPFARRRLASRVRPFVLRRTKAQVAKDLPDRIEEDLCCEIEGEQKTLYRAELKRAQQLLLGIKTQKELAQHQFHFLTSLLRLRQICCDPRLVKPDTAPVGAKTEALLEQLEPLMEEGNKVLVFSQFVEMLELLRPALAERKWPTFYLAGHTENRGDLVREFQAAEGAAVFLISLKAGGFGLNLTAASYVVLFDPWWNPAVESQAIDRTHRIGQTNKVIAYRLLIKNSIEEKIRELQRQKKALALDVLGEEKFAQSLTLQDLQFLFAD